MSIQSLPRPALSPPVTQACAALAEAGQVSLDLVDDDDLATALERLTEAERRAESLRGEVLAEAERRRVPAKHAATATDAWAAALTGEKRQVMAGGLMLAELLSTTYAATREAFAAGRLGFDQAMVIVRAAEQAPPDATADQVRQGEELMVAKATGDATRTGRPMDARRLRQAVRRMFATVDRDLADRHEAILLGRETRRAERDAAMMLGDNGDGTWSGRFTIPELHGHLLKAALEHLTAPRRLHRDQDGKALVDESAPGDNLWDRYGAAFCEVLEHLPTDGHPGSVATLLVTVDLEHLRDGLASAGLDTGTRISAGEARRLACGAGIVPAVMGGASLPLDLGRTRRLFSPAQHKALSLAHDTCGIDTCQRPFAWCELHHRQPWSHGGRTDLDDAVPLCGHHHRRAHDGQFDLRRHPSGGWRLHPRRQERWRRDRTPA